MADDQGHLLCIDRLQHSFVVTSWDPSGAEWSSLWASEMLCATCGTSLTRPDGQGPWRWLDPSDPFPE